MTQLEQFTRTATATPELRATLKAVTNDDEFIALFVAEAQSRGYAIGADVVRHQMQLDRSLAATMSAPDFEEVAGSMLGARLSGGHTSGSGC
jgi:hypothetical protein